MHDSWSDISMEEVNPMVVHERQTLQSYVGPNQMMDVDMNLSRNVTIAANNGKSAAKIPILGREYYFLNTQLHFTAIMCEVRTH